MQDLRYVRIDRFTNGVLVTTIIDTYVWHKNSKLDDWSLQGNQTSKLETQNQATINCKLCLKGKTNEALVKVCRCKNLVFHQKCLIATLVMSMDQKCSKCDTYYKSDRIRREPSFLHFMFQSPIGAPLIFFRIIETVSFCMDIDDLWFSPRRSYGFRRKSLSFLTIQLVLEALAWGYLWLYGYSQWYSKQPTKTIVYRSGKEVHKIVLTDLNIRNNQNQR